jgi:dephospho-CoA kinase
MKKIAITGAQGSGKTYIAMKFAQLQVPVLIIDQVIKQLQSTNQDVISKMQKRFQKCYRDVHSTHECLKKLLFFDKTGKNLKDLSDILRPHLINEFNKFCNEYSNKEWVLVESALIYEYGVQELFDDIIFVKSDPGLRKKVALRRDGISSKEYDLRMKSQLPDSYKIEKCKYIIENDYTENVFEKVIEINSSILKN